MTSRATLRPSFLISTAVAMVALALALAMALGGCGAEGGAGSGARLPTAPRRRRALEHGVLKVSLVEHAVAAQQRSWGGVRVPADMLA